MAACGSVGAGLPPGGPMTPRPLICIAAIVAVLFTQASQADDDSFVEVSALFEAGWKPSSKGLDVARERYEALHEAGKIDPHVSYAYALVQMRNRKYDDAKRLLDEVLRASRDDAEARRAKVWVLMITQNYAAGLAELEILAKNLTAQKADTSSEAVSAGSEFIGRVMGFVDGPAAGAVADAVRADYRKRLLTSLGPMGRQSFEEGYQAVQRRYAELNLDHQQTKADAKADEEDRQKRIREELERERKGLDQEKTSLAARSEKVDADFKRELADLDAQLRPLVTRQTRLEAQGAAITREMASLQVEIGRLLELADLAEDPLEAARLRAEARRLDLELGRYDVDLRAVNGELAGVAAQRITLAGRRQAAIAWNVGPQTCAIPKSASIAMKRRPNVPRPALPAPLPRWPPKPRHSARTRSFRSNKSALGCCSRCASKLGLFQEE
jgi:hypothetical protein